MPKSKLLSPCRVVDSQAINKYKVTTWMVIKSSQTALALEASWVRRENLTIPRRQEFHRSASAKGVHVTKSQTVTFWLRSTCVHRVSPGKVPIKQMYLSPNAPITKDIRLWKEHDWESMVQMQPNPVSWFRLDSNTICTGDYSCSSLSLKTLCIPFSKICFYWCVCVYVNVSVATAEARRGHQIDRSWQQNSSPLEEQYTLLSHQSISPAIRVFWDIHFSQQIFLKLCRQVGRGRMR